MKETNCHFNQSSRLFFSTGQNNECFHLDYSDSFDKDIQAFFKVCYNFSIIMIAENYKL